MALSSRGKSLTAVECRAKAEECHLLALRGETIQLRAMIEQIAEIWLAVAREIETKR
jgi:hypothetical protein